MGVLLVGMALILMMQILIRGTTGKALTWAEELARYFYVWSVFLSLGCTIRKKNILKVDLLLHVLPKSVQKLLALALEAMNLVLFSYLGYHAISVVNKVQLGKQTSPAMEIPMYIIYIIVPVGFFIASLRSLQQLYFIAREK